MIFRPELAAKVLSGDKTVTRRVASENPRSPWWEDRCRYAVDHVYAVQPGRGKAAIGHIRIVSVALEPLSWALTTAGEPEREGFASMREFMAAWEAINGEWNPTTLVWRVSFRAVR